MVSKRETELQGRIMTNAGRLRSMTTTPRLSGSTYPTYAPRRSRQVDGRTWLDLKMEPSRKRRRRHTLCPRCPRPEQRPTYETRKASMSICHIRGSMGKGRASKEGMTLWLHRLVRQTGHRVCLRARGRLGQGHDNASEEEPEPAGIAVVLGHRQAGISPRHLAANPLKTTGARADPRLIF